MNCFMICFPYSSHLFLSLSLSLSLPPKNLQEGSKTMPITALFAQIWDSQAMPQRLIVAGDATWVIPISGGKPPKSDKSW